MSKQSTAAENLSDFLNLEIWNVLSGLLTPVILVFGAYIAYQQLKTNRDNLRERLFDRRMEVFQETQRFLSIIVSYSRFEQQDLEKFTTACQKSRFLFGKELSEYLFELRKTAIDLEYHDTMIKNPIPDEDHGMHVREKLNNFKKLSSQLDEIFVRFSPSLEFEHKK